MATTQAFIDELLARIGPASGVTARAMFGEFALYLDGKVVALACDQQLFVKPTVPGRGAVRHVDEASPYPGAKPHLRIVDELDDADALRHLLAVTAAASPVPKPRTRKAAAKTAAKRTGR